MNNRRFHEMTGTVCGVRTRAAGSAAPATLNRLSVNLPALESELLSDFWSVTRAGTCAKRSRDAQDPRRHPSEPISTLLQNNKPREIPAIPVFQLRQQFTTAPDAQFDPAARRGDALRSCAEADLIPAERQGSDLGRLDAHRRSAAL